MAAARQIFRPFLLQQRCLAGQPRVLSSIPQPQPQPQRFMTQTSFRSRQTFSSPARWDRFQQNSALRRTFCSAAAAEAEEPQTPKEFQASPKVQELIDQISNLTIVETVELVDALKVKFNYVEQAVVAGVAAPAGGAAAEEAAPKEEEKTHFTVKLTGYSAEGKIKLIKEVRKLTDLGLKQCKELVDGVPSVLKENVPKADAEALVKSLQELGATVELE